MPASLVMAVNFAAGISARGRSGETGAAVWVIGNGGGSLRLSSKAAPPNKRVTMTRTGSNQRTVLSFIIICPTARDQRPGHRAPLQTDTPFDPPPGHPAQEVKPDGQKRRDDVCPAGNGAQA